MKLSEWVARKGMHYQTAWHWWQDGRRPKLRRVLPDLCVTVIVVEHRCRLDGRRGARNRAVRAVTAAKNAKVDAVA